MTDQSSTKVGLATQQLDEAISLFLKGQFVSALTLSGAAAEALGKALSDRGEQNYLDWKYETFQPLQPLLHGTPLSKEAFIRDENRALTAVASGSEPSVTLDLEEAASWMIVRACHNYDLRGLLRTAKMREFQDWFDEHIVGQGQFYDDVVGVEFP
jgi:hypothetical protein